MKYYVVSDIHSFFDEFKSALDATRFKENSEECKLLVLGDIFDRGSQAEEILEYLSNLKNCIYIRGNHEDLLLECLEQLKRGEVQRHHILNGTLDTIAQLTNTNRYDLLCGIYNYNEIESRMQKCVEFINSAVDYYETENYIFVHGWIPQKDGNYYEDWRSVDWYTARWINPIVNCNTNKTEKTIICGHWSSCEAHSFFEEKENFTDFSPYYGNGIIMIDGTTALSHVVNVIEIED